MNVVDSSAWLEYFAGRRHARTLEPVLGAQVTIPKAAIEEAHEAGSPMPEGLTAVMTRTEVRDLIRYLVELEPR